MQSSADGPSQPDDDAFRGALRAIVDRSGRSLRSLSVAMGRDVGYLAALLDPSRPSRARPTPTDLLRLSDTTGLAFVEVLEQLWAIPQERLAFELGGLPAHESGSSLPELTAGDRQAVAAFEAFLADRHRRPHPLRPPEGGGSAERRVIGWSDIDALKLGGRVRTG